MNAEQQIAELKARGAIEVKDGTGSGFDDDLPLDAALENDPVLAQEVAELEARQHDIVPPSQHVEAAQAAREDNLERVRKYQFDKQQEVTDYIPGQIMHKDEFLRRLKTLDPTFFYNDFSAMGLRGLGHVKNGIAVFLTSVQDGQMIEWSQLRVDQYQIGTNEVFRGWRTALMNIIDKGALTEDQVHKLFGKPTGPRAKRWFRNLFSIRNGFCRDCDQKICVCRGIGESARADAYARPA